MKPEEPQNIELGYPADFCRVCGSPDQLEAHLCQFDTVEERQLWQAHLRNSPDCRQIVQEDAITRSIFEECQADPFFQYLNNTWQFDLSLAIASEAVTINGSDHGRNILIFPSQESVRETVANVNPAAISSNEPHAIYIEASDEPKLAGHLNSSPALSSRFWPRTLVAGLMVMVVAALALLLIAGNQATNPKPASTSPTPVTQIVNLQSDVFLGPDNLFHRDGGQGLVSATPSPKIGTTTNMAEVQLNWLVSDPKGVYIGGTLLAKPTNTGYSLENYENREAVLTDEANRRYNLTITSFGPLSGSNQQPYYFIMKGPALPAVTREVTFSSNEGVSFNLSSPIKLSLQTFKEAKLPQAVNFSNAVTEVKGVKVRIPYGYLGPDKTALAVQFEPGSALESDTQISVNKASDLNLSVVDDKGRSLRPLAGPSSPPDWANFYHQPNETMVILEPVSSGVKNLSLKITNLNIKSLALPSLVSGQTGLDIPLEDLLKSGSKGVPVASNSVLETRNFRLQLLSQQAVPDTTGEKIRLKLVFKYNVLAPIEGAVLQHLDFTCQGCSPDSESNDSFDASQQTVNTNFLLNGGAVFRVLHLTNYWVIYTLPFSWQINLPL